MTPEQRAEIERLAGEAHDAAERVRYLAMSNTPTDPTERRASRIAYEVAVAKAAEADAKLRAALGNENGPPLRREAGQ